MPVLEFTFFTCPSTALIRSFNGPIIATFPVVAHVGREKMFLNPWDATSKDSLHRVQCKIGWQGQNQIEPFGSR